jgi:hypothetical protein
MDPRPHRANGDGHGVGDLVIGQVGPCEEQQCVSVACVEPGERFDE